MRAYHSQSKNTVTMSAAMRELEVSRHTFTKWVKLGYVKLLEVGPGGSRLVIRRVPVSEVERLRRETRAS